MGRRSAAVTAGLAALVFLGAPGASAMPVDPPPVVEPAPRLVPPRPPVACVVPASQPARPLSAIDPCSVKHGPRVDRHGSAWCLRQTLFLGDPSLPACRPAPVPPRPPAVPAH